MADLAEFLIARIAEDERDARSANVGQPWIYVDRTMRVEVGSDSDYWAPSAADHAADCDYEDHWECSDARRNALIEGDHIVRWQPARVLAECEAKRRIVEQCKEWLSYGPVKSWETDRGEDAALSEDAAPAILRLLALPYTNHPRYREEWRP
jgi:hypothetical protein